MTQEEIRAATKDELIYRIEILEGRVQNIQNRIPSDFWCSKYAGTRGYIEESILIRKELEARGVV